MARVCPKRERLPSNVPIQSDPAVRISTSLNTHRRVTPDRVIAFLGAHPAESSLELGLPLTQELHNRACYDALRVLEGLLRDTNDQLVQSRKQKLENRRLVRLFVAEDQLDSRRVSLERTTRYRGRQKVLRVSR